MVVRKLSLCNIVLIILIGIYRQQVHGIDSAQSQNSTDTENVTLSDTNTTDIPTIEECYHEECGCAFRHDSPLVRCSFLPLEFLTCQEPIDLNGNGSMKNATDGYGCTKFGGQRYEDVEFTKVWCTVLPDIECHGDRVFLRKGFPCIKLVDLFCRYNGHYFVTTLLYSILLGFLGMDRFCLGHTGTAVGKLLTLGGVGLWWIIDIILLVTGSLVPDDGSNWEPYY